MANTKTFEPIQAVIETWWREHRPEGSHSPAPLDLPIYRELLAYAQKQLQESKIAEKKSENGETKYVAITPGGEYPFHDDPPIYEAHPTEHTQNLEAKELHSLDSLKRVTPDVKTILPVDTPFTCGGVYDYIGRNGSNTYGILGSKPDSVTYQLTMTSAGIVNGSSKDVCGPASIEGTIDCETGAVELIKRYSWCNLWAQWEYHGQLQRVDSRPVILGRWESGRFAIWLDGNGVNDNDKTVAQMLHLLDLRDMQSRTEGCTL